MQAEVFEESGLFAMQGRDKGGVDPSAFTDVIPMGSSTKTRFVQNRSATTGRAFILSKNKG